MQVAVLGAGVIGLTTAWALAEDGHDVTILDRNTEPGAETSFANGAQLSYAYVAPLASPSILAKIPGLLLDPAGPLRIKPQLDLDFIRWGLEFLAACTSQTEIETTKAQLALAALSRSELDLLKSGLNLDFGLKNNGKLVIIRDAKSFQHARETATQLKQLGVDQTVLSPAECLREEPALQIRAQELAGGILTPSEQVGDCAAFCQGLSQHLRRRNNVKWLMNTEILAPITTKGRLSAVTTSQGEIAAEAFVLSMGAFSTPFAKKLKLRLPIYPMKGYSFTARLSKGSLGRSVTDLNNKIVFAPLGEGQSQAIRVAGIADLVGYSPAINGARFAGMRKTALKTMSLETSDVTPWAGLRPATPDSRPLIGWSPVPGLFLNTGHGALGWTLACGSARLTAELLVNGNTSVNPNWFSLRRSS